MLQLVQQAYNEMGIGTTPTTVAGSTNVDLVQLLALMNALGNELARQHDWQAMTKEHRFNTIFYQYTGNTTANSTSLTGMSSIVGLDSKFMVTGNGLNVDTDVVSAAVTTVVINPAALDTTTGQTFTFGQTKYVMPTDYDRQIDRTHYDKSKQWEMLGPETAQQWEWLKSSYISTGPRIRYRILGGYFQIWPIPSSTEYLGFEYVSSSWVNVTGATQPTKSSFTVDTDTCIFPDRLMVLGAKLKYFEIKGFDTTAFYRDYNAQLDIAKANDAGSPTLSFAPTPSSVLIGWDNIPDSNYGNT